MSVSYNNWDCIAPQQYFWNDPLPYDSSDLVRADFFPKDQHTLINLNTTNDYLCAIQNCAPLAGIILSSAQAFSNGLFEVLNRKTQNYVRGEYKEWEYLLENPNPFCNKSQFMQLLWAYTDMRGWCYAIPIYGSGYKDRPRSIYLLPPWCVEVELKDKKRPFYTYKKGESIRNVWFCYNGTKVALKEEELMLFTDSTLSLDEKTLLPVSKLRNVHYPLSNYISSEEASLTLTQNRGPVGFISNNSKDQVGNISMSPEDKEQIQSDFRKYGTRRDLLQYVISNQSLGWVPVGVNVAEMMLDENRMNAVKSMCFVLQYPFILTPFSDQSTYNNIPAAQKDLYQGCIIPKAKNLIEQLNYNLGLVEQNVEIKVTYEDVPAFQQSQKERGEGKLAMDRALKMEWDNFLITRNMWLKEIGRDEMKDPEFSLYKNQMTPDQLGIVEQNIKQITKELIYAN